jgi:hypothetical protein
MTKPDAPTQPASINRTHLSKVETGAYQANKHPREFALIFTEIT